MEISEALVSAIRDQIGIELTASNAYLSMAAFFERNAYDGFPIGCVCNARKSGPTR
jgi:ferritin